MSTTDTNTSRESIVFIDGVCVLCDRSAKWLIRRDKKEALSFASLQSAFTRNRLSEEHTKKIKYIAFLDDGNLFIRSAAIVKILQKLGGGYAFLGKVISWIPAFIRDWAYDLIAKYRYRIFGKKDRCELPDPGVRERFVDSDDAAYYG